MTPIRAFWGAIGWLLVTFGVAWFGSRFPPDEWYKGLAKPSWNPPNWIFAPVWIVLYFLMAIAAWLLWKRFGIAGASVPLLLYAIQLLLNAAWSWLFFGLHRPDLALVDIVVLGFAILTTLISFCRLELLAAVLLVPYLFWVWFATILNWKIWKMNRAERSQ
jgi:translocator protein